MIDRVKLVPFLVWVYGDDDVFGCLVLLMSFYCFSVDFIIYYVISPFCFVINFF